MSSCSRVAIVGAIAIASLSVASDAMAQAKLEAGTLTCQGKGSVGLILGSKQSLKCVFTPIGNAPKQAYSATITKIGLDVGIKGANTIVWTVLYSTDKIPAGALAGKYTGASADVSVGIGGGANLLVGGSKSSVALQPLSVQGQTGVNLAVGVSGLALTYTP